MRNTVSQNNPTAGLHVATCKFCGCRAAPGFHWYKPPPTPYLFGHACNDCSQHLDTLSDEELQGLLTARAVTEALYSQCSASGTPVLTGDMCTGCGMNFTSTGFHP